MNEDRRDDCNHSNDEKESPFLQGISWKNERGSFQENPPKITLKHQ